MSTPSHPESAPLNDTDAAKQLQPDPQLEKVERLEDESRDLGLSQEEAQARAWSEVNNSGAADTAQPKHRSGGDDAPDISVGG